MQKEISLMSSTFFNENVEKAKLLNFIKKSNKLSMGNYVKKFEKKFSKFIGLKYTTMVNSGSSANLLLLQSLKNIGLLKDSDCIGFSALTWSTNVMPIIQLGMIPVPIDVTLETLNISEKILEDVLKKNKLKCLFLTNVLGFADDVSKIVKICKKKKIILIEDNCESLGSEINKKKLGSFGLASTHSFYVGHHISSIEGGSVSTSSPKLDDMLKITRAHGWARNLNSQSEKRLIKKYNIKEFYRKYTFYDLGFNLRPTEINAFLGFNQLNYLKKIIKIRFKNFLSFNNIYKKNSSFKILKLMHMNVISNFTFPIICKNKKIFKKYIDIFKKNYIEIRPLIAGDITQQPFYKKYIKKKHEVPNTKLLHETSFYIPNRPDLNRTEIKKICNLLK